MKLRLQGNSLRLRLKRSKVERLCETGAVEFGCGAMLTYRLQTAMHPGPAQPGFKDGTIAVFVGTDEAQAWANSDEVGIYAQAGALVVSIEKDFRCLTRPLDEHERDTSPNPGEL